jgi:hypothetical protein
MADLALTEAERRFFRALDDLGIRYLIVGVSAAVLQGADAVTADIDLWFEDRGDRRLRVAAERAGGVFVDGQFGMMPPMLGGEGLGDRLDVVLTVQGMEDFDVEYRNARAIEVDGMVLRVLPLGRVIDSKRTAGRRKDLAALPALEAALAVERDDGSDGSAPGS